MHFFRGKKEDSLNYEKPVPLTTISGAIPDLKDQMDLTFDNSKRKIFRTPFPAKTKPQLIDLNADGNLDLIYGEQYGHFIKFDGTAAKGINHFSDKGEILRDISGAPLRIGGDSAPHFIDWDGDKDLDIISGNALGGIYYSENTGNPTSPQWQPFTEWLAPLEAKDRRRGRHTIQNTRETLKPNSETTVFVLDYNNDGKLDLLVGDKTQLNIIVDGVTNEEYKVKEAQLREMQDIDGPDDIAYEEYYDLKSLHRNNKTPESEKLVAEALKRASKLQDITSKKEKDFKNSFKTTEYTGFIWLYLQK